MTPSAASAASIASQRESAEAGWAKVLVLHGAAWLTLMIYVWTAWVVSGDFRVNARGRGQEPGWYVTLVHGWELFALCCSVVIMWWFVIRPRLNTGRLTIDGIFFLACLALCFQEPWINWTSYQFTYATTSINFGSFTSHIPGWSSPNSQLVPLSLWALSGYFWLLGLPAWAGSHVMRRLRRRRPSMSGLRLIACTYLGFCVFDLVLEGFITHIQLYSYASVVPELSLWAGTDHQFPLYEAACWAGTWTGVASLHFFRDDRGRTLVDRGVDRLRIKREGLRTFARYLALMGAFQAVMLVTYNIPYAYFGTHAVMAEPFIEREWRNGGVCGPTTAYDCPAADVPLATTGSPTNRIAR